MALQCKIYSPDTYIISYSYTKCCDLFALIVISPFESVSECESNPWKPIGEANMISFGSFSRHSCTAYDDVIIEVLVRKHSCVCTNLFPSYLLFIWKGFIGEFFNIFKINKHSFIFIAETDFSISYEIWFEVVVFKTPDEVEQTPEESWNMDEQKLSFF